MSENANTIRKNLLLAMIVSTAMASPLNAWAQDLPELSTPQETSSQDAELDINDVLQGIDDVMPVENSVQEGNEILQDTASDLMLKIEPDEIMVKTPEPVMEETPQPAANELIDPQSANAQAAEDQAANLPNIPSLRADQEADDGLFFDAEQNVPRSEISRKGAPRKISPADEPGTRIIVVKTNHGSNSKKAEMVAAERAMKLGRYAAALDMYEVMYAKNKRDPNILMGRAEAYQRLGQHDFAVQAYEELLDLRPNNVEARINMLGLIGQKFPAVALRQLLDLRQKHPENVGIVAQIAGAKAALGEFNDAIRFLGIAASLEPQNPSHLFNMAVIADTAGDRKQAISLYEQALEADTLYGKGASIPRDSIFERLASLR